MSSSIGVSFIPNDITMNFSGTTVVVSNCAVNSNTGIIQIHNYDESTDSFLSPPYTISGPSTESYFGQSVDIDWDGNRVVVGANALANVYVYDYSESGGIWVNSNVLSSTVGSDFGYSLSISKDGGDILAVGAPQHNNVYIYEMLSENIWTISNVLNGSHINNIIGYNSVSDLILIPEYNRYGESVKLSGLGNYIIVGQPGSLLSYITNSDATNFNIIASNYLEPDGSLKINLQPYATYEYFNYFYYWMYRQEGSVQVFKTDNQWHLSNTQVGNTLYGERNCVITDSERTSARGWSPSGFGMNVSISLDGSLITVGAPLFSLKGGAYEIHNGKIYTYVYDPVHTQNWSLEYSSTGNRQNLQGLSFAMDYEGTRLASIPKNNRFGSSLSVFDWNGTDWYDVESIKYFYNILREKDFSRLDITNGKVVFITQDYLLTRYTFPLTQSFKGNSLFAGYVSVPQLYIGTNDSNFIANTDSPATSKIISFGGSYGENTYDSTTIENRIYETYDGTYNTAGKSELLIAKTNKISAPNISSGGIDFIRLKANEIRLDYHESGIDDKYERTPVLVCNYRGNIGIKIPETQPDINFKSTTNTKANMDINGSVYVRNKLTLSDPARCNIISKYMYPGIIWDTRKPNTVQGVKVYSNIFGNYETTDRSATMSGNVSYSSTEYAFYFLDASGKINTDEKTQYVGDSGITEINCWIKLTEPQSTKTSSERIATIGDIPSSNNGSINITTSGIEINYRNGGCIFSNTAVFQTNVWYHLNTIFAPPDVTPTTGNTSLKINNSQMTLTQSGTTTSNYDRDPVGQIHYSLGSGLSNAYVGMVSIGLQNYLSPQPSDWYNNGPPDEILAIGGGATMSGKLGVGVTNPTESLEVSGNVHVSGHVTNASPKFFAYNSSSGTTSSTGVVNVFGQTRVNIGGHYNISNSRFTAPVDGTYEFKFTGIHKYVSGNGYCELTFVKNGGVTPALTLSNSYVSSSHVLIQNSVEIMMDLQTGDYVEPYLRAIDSGTTFEYGDTIGFFSGKFLG